MKNFQKMNYLINAQWNREQNAINELRFCGTAHRPSQYFYDHSDKYIFILPENWDPNFEQMSNIAKEIVAHVVKFRTLLHVPIDPLRPEKPWHRIEFFCTYSERTEARARILLNGEIPSEGIECYYRWAVMTRMCFGKRERKYIQFTPYISIRKALLGKSGITWDFIDELEAIAEKYKCKVN